MSLNPRQESLLKLLAQREWLSVEDAVAALGTSPATLRRDLQTLEEAGALQRYRGGARLARGGGMVTFHARELQSSEAKDRIARRAAELLEPGNVVFIDGGTTTFHLARYLPAFALKIITNSIRLATVLDEASANRPELELILVGGRTVPGSGLLVGPSAETAIRQYHADWALLSAGGLDEQGIYNSDELVVESERAMIANSNRNAVLIDASKVGRRALCRVCSLDQVHTIVSEAELTTVIGDEQVDVVRA